MLGRISNQCEMKPRATESAQEDRWSRNECEDTKKAIDYLYEFNEKLCKLHPNAVNAVEKLLQNRY